MTSPATPPLWRRPQTVFALQAITYGVWATWLMLPEFGRPNGGALFIAAATLAVLTVLPALVMLRNRERWRTVYLVTSGLTLLLWLFLPLAQHSFDRTSPFWLIWGWCGALALAGVWLATKRK